MTDVFPADCKRLSRSLFVFMTLSIVISVLLILGMRFVVSGFSYAETFKHMSPLSFCMIVACTPVFTALFAWLISLWYRLATITISEEAIHGRSYWGRKNSIPLHDIVNLTHFSNNGIKAIVVHGNHHGKIYISDKTTRLRELLDFLSKQIDADQQKPMAEAGSGE